MANVEFIRSKLDIDKNDWVLEIGGGPTPFLRSDILADKFLEDNLHRSGQLVVDRPLVVCDAHELPFVDKSFDYVFCSQLLEHLEQPERFFEELARVGRKGYIETPNEIRERLFGWPFHKWVVDQEKNGLVLRENDLEQPFGVLFHKLQLENHEFATFCGSWHDLLNVCYEWHDTPKFRFAEHDEYSLPSEKVCLDAERAATLRMAEPYNKRAVSQRFMTTGLRKRIPQKLKQWIKRSVTHPRYGYRHSDEEANEYLQNILACPICKVKVSFEEKTRIICPKCRQRFEIKNNIPVMLKQ